MNFKIVSDSSSDILSVADIPYESVPLTIKTSETEYVDNADLDITKMLDDLAKYSGKSGSACPNFSDWKKAYGDVENVFAITITSGLSGSYNSACVAANEWKEEKEEKLRELILEGLDFQTIVEKIKEYQKYTHLAFSLERIRNLANNGRVNPAIAKIIGILGIRLVGKASNKGELEMTDKTRGSERAIGDIIKNMIKNGYNGGKARIHHCENLKSAELLKNKLLEKFPSTNIEISTNRGLCSFYAERGGVMIAYEGSAK